MPQVTFYPPPSQIASITNAVNATIVTLTPHQLEDGARIRFIVPESYGMQINNVQTTVLVVDDVTLQTPLDTRKLDAFVIPPQTFVYPEPAQIIAVGGPGLNQAQQSVGNL